MIITRRLSWTARVLCTEGCSELEQCLEASMQRAEENAGNAHCVQSLRNIKPSTGLHYIMWITCTERWPCKWFGSPKRERENGKWLTKNWHAEHALQLYFWFMLITANTYHEALSWLLKGIRGLLGNLGCILRCPRMVVRQADVPVWPGPAYVPKVRWELIHRIS